MSTKESHGHMEGFKAIDDACVVLKYDKQF